MFQHHLGRTSTECSTCQPCQLPDYTAKATICPRFCSWMHTITTSMEREGTHSTNRLFFASRTGWTLSICGFVLPSTHPSCHYVTINFRQNKARVHRSSSYILQTHEEHGSVSMRANENACLPGQSWAVFRLTFNDRNVLAAVEAFVKWKYRTLGVWSVRLCRKRQAFSCHLAKILRRKSGADWDKVFYVEFHRFGSLIKPMSSLISQLRERSSLKIYSGVTYRADAFCRPRERPRERTKQWWTDKLKIDRVCLLYGWESTWNMG